MKTLPPPFSRYAITEEGVLYSLIGNIPYKMSQSSDGCGYLRTSLSSDKSKKITCHIHRLVWIAFNGNIGDGLVIDHINHNILDNNLSNLRLVTIQDNLKNKKKSPRNTSGVTGVSWDNQRKKWLAQICVNGKNTYIGRFDNIEDAISKRKEAEKEHGYHVNHGK